MGTVTWHIKDLVITICLMVIMIFAVGRIGTDYLYGNILLQYYALYLIVLIAIVLLIPKYGSRLFAIDDIKLLALYTLIGGFVAVCVVLLGYAFGAGEVPEVYNAYQNWRTTERYLYVFQLMLIAPFLEEILFRGLFYRIIKHRFNIGWAIIVSTFIFLAFHSFRPSIVYQGLFYIFIYEKSKSIWGNIITHLIYNGTWFSLNVMS